LTRLRRIASWAGRDPSAALGGDLAALLFEYLNMVFWLDANALFFGARELRARASELLRVIAAVGEIDAAVSVASYRASTPGWTRPVFRSTDTTQLTDVRHPLLPDAVPNSITLGPPHGVIITGSNMSGKTTFLRTIGVTAVLAQDDQHMPGTSVRRTHLCRTKLYWPGGRSVDGKELLPGRGRRSPRTCPRGPRSRPLPDALR
jgi:hypothetical protein